MFSLLFFYLNLLCCSFHFAHFVFFFAFWLFFPLVIYCRVVFSTYLLIQRTDVSVDYDETLIFHSKFRARKLRELTWKSRPPAHPRVIFFVDGKPRSGILLEKEGWGRGGGGEGERPSLPDQKRHIYRSVKGRACGRGWRFSQWTTPDLLSAWLGMVKRPASTFFPIHQNCLVELKADENKE